MHELKPTETTVAAVDAAASEPEAKHACACRELEPLADFDALIARLREVLPADARELPAVRAGEMPVAVGEHAGRGVVLKSRCAVELGGACGSGAMVLSTANTELVSDGRVSLVGPDICELPVGSEVPFAQVILVAGEELTGPCHQDLEECQSVKDWIEGYFVRSAPGELLTRVSTASYEAGFGFAHLGAALIELVRSASPLVDAVEVVFVTSSREDVARVAELGAEWREVSHTLRHEVWMEKGVDIDCARGGHCGQCGDREVCTQVRKIERMRKRINELDEQGALDGVGAELADEVGGDEASERA